MPTPQNKPLTQNLKLAQLRLSRPNLDAALGKKDVAVVVQVTCNRWHRSQSVRYY